MSLYKKDDKDSANQKERKSSMSLFDQAAENLSQRLDNTDEAPMDEGSVEEPFSDKPVSSSRKRRSSTARAAKDKTDELEQKLAFLQKTLRDADSQDPASGTSRRQQREEPEASPEMAQLQTMMAEFEKAKSQTEQDPELHQMSGMLDKILDIQHPERVSERLADKKAANPRQNLEVAPTIPRKTVDDMLGGALTQDTGTRTTIPVSTSAANDGFYELGQTDTGPQGVSASIAAVVDGTQVLVSGSTIKVRILQDIYVQGQRIPKGSNIYGACSLTGERMLVEFNTLRMGQQIFPVALTAYSLDGLPGIRAEGSINRDAAKKGTSDALQGVGLTTLDPSLGAQAASAGIETATKLLSRRVKLVQVTAKSDYPILLRDNSNSR